MLKLYTHPPGEHPSVQFVTDQVRGTPVERYLCVVTGIAREGERRRDAMVKRTAEAFIVLLVFRMREREENKESAGRVRDA